jgi:hypothetical protein
LWPGRARTTAVIAVIPRLSAPPIDIATHPQAADPTHDPGRWAFVSLFTDLGSEMVHSQLPVHA